MKNQIEEYKRKKGDSVPEIGLLVSGVNFNFNESKLKEYLSGLHGKVDLV